MSSEAEINSPARQPAGSVIDDRVSCGVARKIGTRLRKPAAKSADFAIGALLCILAAVAWLPRASGPIDMRWDGGAYYLLGTSITHGQGYRLLNEPGNPNTTLHPPLLPMF